VRQNQPKQVLHTASCYSPYIPEYVGNQPATSVPSSHYHHHCHLLTPEASNQKGTSTPNSSATSRRSLKLVQSIALYQNRSIYTEEYPTFDVPLSFMSFYFLYEKQVTKDLISISCNNCACIRVKYLSWTSEARKTFLRKRSKFRSSKVVPKGIQSQNNYDPKLKKSFLRERCVSFLLRSRS
jgi:hypothetical protein